MTRASLLLAATLGACGPASSPPAPAEPVVWPDPVVEVGPISAAREVRAAELYAAAREAMEAGRAGEARQLAARVVEEFPRAPVSGVALSLLAQAAFEDGRYDTADDAAGRFSSLVARGDPRGAEARLFQAEAQARLGDQVARLERLLGIPPGAPAGVVARARDDAREASAALGVDALGAVLGEVPADGPVRPVALARYALALQGEGREEEAHRAARAALEAGARGTDSLTAADVLAGRSGSEGPRRVVTLGTVLPTGGSPAFRDFAALIAEGVEVAAASYLQGFATVRIEARDDRGQPALAAVGIRELEEAGVLGAVGFLETGALQAAGDVRRGALPLVSPTARTARGSGLYTLSGADPQAAAALARYAARVGFRRVAVIHSQAPESVEEADAFTAALQALGVPLAGRFAYPVGTTYFRSQIEEAEEALRGAEIRALGLGPEDTLHAELLEPVALFAPVPAEDVELLAPQITFYGLDTLAVKTLGTSGWTDPQTLAAVDPRHTTGVVATAPVGAGEGAPGHVRFRQAYERRFRRSLVSPVPALGYDAALLLLEAARTDPRSPGQYRAALERIRDLEGATGTFSVVAGRVLRRTHVVLLEHGSLIPLG